MRRGVGGGRCHSRGTTDHRGKSEARGKWGHVEHDGYIGRRPEHVGGGRNVKMGDPGRGRGAAMQGAAWCGARLLCQIKVNESWRERGAQPIAVRGARRVWSGGWEGAQPTADPLIPLLGAGSLHHCHHLLHALTTPTVTRSDSAVAHMQMLSPQEHRTATVKTKAN
ncbi:hypothetical protein E2C01_032171 [Portunus trituberculatus]|uniref:Uncharacterized protein n=1 Tax=Portunus trituberculatus TaxID=210409 RepID=A0A5B7EVC4_PORTR|nr:hypothetical protein [Portunus trituberculatus]